jgi:hypothetical protein
MRRDLASEKISKKPKRWVGGIGEKHISRYATKQ